MSVDSCCKVDIGTRAKGKLYAWKQGVLVFNLTMPVVSRMGLRLLPFDVYCPSVTADNRVFGTQCIQDKFTKLMEFNMFELNIRLIEPMEEYFQYLFGFAPTSTEFDSGSDWYHCSGGGEEAFLYSDRIWDVVRFGVQEAIERWDVAYAEYMEERADAWIERQNINAGC